MPTCVFINLDRDEARRMHMEAQCAKAGLPFARFSAANGSNLPDGLRQFFPFAADAERSFLSPGETGCYASHLAICQKVVAGDLPAPLLVLEDDVELPENVGALVDAIISRLPADWDIVRLTNDSKQVAAPTASVGGHRIVRYSNIPGSTGALLWSQAGAKKFLAAEPRSLPVDQDLRRVWHWRLNTFGVLPAPIRRDIFDVSSIDGMTSAGWRSKKRRQAHLRAARRREAGARFAHGAHTFGTGRWLLAETLSALIAIAPKRSRPVLLERAGALLATR